MQKITIGILNNLNIGSKYIIKVSEMGKETFKEGFLKKGKDRFFFDTDDGVFYPFVGGIFENFVVSVNITPVLEKIRLTFLGSGSAFVLGKENFNSNILFETGEDNCLFDAGTTLADALDMQGFSEQDIKKVFISHLHGDHSGGMEMLGFKTYFSKFPLGSHKVKVYSSKDILRDMWDKQLSLSMNSISTDKFELSTFFDVNALDFTMEDNFSGYESFNIGSIKAIPVKTFHSHMDSFGLYLKEKDIFITGDTKFTPNKFKDLFKKAKIIFHDCEFKDYENGFHAQFRQLKTLSEEIKSKMYLYHYSLGDKTFEELEKEVLDEGFKGLVQRGFSIEV